MPMKLRYDSPPSVIVSSRIILCSAMPRSTAGLEGPKPGADMKSYMSLSMSQNAIVLSPTRLVLVFESWLFGLVLGRVGIGGWVVEVSW